MRKFLCLYLNTGGGHKSAAKVLETVMSETHPDVEMVLAEGFHKSDYYAKFLIEKWYQIACNFIPGAWPLFYELSNFKFTQKFVERSVNPHILFNLTKILNEHDITDIVVFHFLLTSSVIRAVRKNKKNVRFTVIVTDPFTTSSGWFYDKSSTYIVASEQMKDFAIQKCKINEKQVKVLPFLINPKFHNAPSLSRIEDLRNKYTIPKENKVLLITGGGDGLPNVIKIMQYLLLLKPNFTIFVVCGRDVTSFQLLSVMAQVNSKVDLRVLGFISYMEDMIHLCDLAIIKAGPATVFEALCSNKPVIISTYLHNQELGNVRYAMSNKVGKYIYKPKQIARAAYDLLNNEKKLIKIKKRFSNFKIDTDIHKVADFLYEKNT